MRVKAQDDGLPVPAFVHVLNEERIREFCRARAAALVPQAAAPGGRHRHPQDRRRRRAVGGRPTRWATSASYFLLEEFVAGDVFHVDSIVYEREVLAAVAEPLRHAAVRRVARRRRVHDAADGTRTRARRASCCDAQRAGAGVARAGARRVAQRVHPRRDGRLVFLETSARVGGAHIAELIEAATGINMWAEWAKIEVAGGKAPYAVPPMRSDYAGLIVSLARQERPTSSAYTDPEIVWRLQKPNHAGLIVRSPSLARVDELLASYAERFTQDFVATLARRADAV